MRFDELDVPDNVADALREHGFIELHPPQASALPIALEGHSIVVSVPTASGKSLIGYIPAIKKVLEEHKKVLYIVPLKALASEKKEDLDSFSHLGFTVAMSTGDLDSDDGGVRDADIVVATSEKADSMIRHGSRWIDSVGLVIADEVHMIHDPGRGPTLEVALTKLMRRNPNLQIIALSATISNAEDLAMWLDAKLVRSDWRPVPLREGVFFDGEIKFDDMKKKEVPAEKDEIWALIKQTIEEGGQCLVFVNARRSTESLATKYSAKMEEYAGRTLSKQDSDLLEGGSETTSLGKKLAQCVSSGTAFHNAGLTYRQRKYVEDNFRSGLIKCIVATPTLAAGINLPARRVIVRDTGRFESNAGMVPISVMEVKQMCGRAGRPGYDPYGEAVLIAKNLRDSDRLMYDYIMHDTERLTSKLGNEVTLRSHMLGLIATGDASSDDDIVDFLRSTFYGSTSSLFGVESVVEKVTDFLAREGMIEKNGGSVRILPFGKRISDLYIDPKSAVILRDAVKNMKEDTDVFSVLLAAALTPDVMGLYPKKSDEARLGALAEEYEGKCLFDPFEDPDFNYEVFMGALKVSAMTEDWISEIPEDVLTESLGIGPGDVRSRVDMMDWIMYSMSEIAYIMRPDSVRAIRPLLTRIKYGVKDELIDLVSFRGVGRTRARTLYNAGYRKRSDIMSADENKLASLPRIGPSLAKSLKNQAGGSVGKEIPMPEWDPEMEDLDAMSAEFNGEKVSKQSNIFDF
ncbi:MAG: DEAD/DEAH box helicase [Methanomassiliicoccaceae archaeon]|nr:DEAD/DEAH box helicase [Methanomassiliicoccaceae archaeon]